MEPLSPLHISRSPSGARCAQVSNITSVNQDVSEFLEKRLGRLHGKLRLGIETDHEAQVFGQGIIIFTLRSLHSPEERLADARLRLRAIEASRAPAARPP